MNKEKQNTDEVARRMERALKRSLVTRPIKKKDMPAKRQKKAGNPPPGQA